MKNDFADAHEFVERNERATTKRHTLMLSNDERNALQQHARDLRLVAQRIERHVQQNITNVDAARYVSNMQALVDVINDTLARADADVATRHD